MSKRLAPPPLEATMFPPASRAADPDTSKQAERRMQVRRGTQARTILAMYRAYKDGLTDAEVERYLHMRGSWKRSSDLRNAGLIAPTGEVREGQRVCAITPDGLAALGD